MACRYDMSKDKGDTKAGFHNQVLKLNVNSNMC